MVNAEQVGEFRECEGQLKPGIPIIEILKFLSRQAEVPERRKRTTLWRILIERLMNHLLPAIEETHCRFVVPDGQIRHQRTDFVSRLSQTAGNLEKWAF